MNLPADRSADRPESPLDPELVALEQALTGFQPTSPRIDRDRLMFLAGRASALRATNSEPLDAVLEVPSDAPFERPQGGRRAPSGSRLLAAVASAAAVLFATLWGVERARREPAPGANSTAARPAPTTIEGRLPSDRTNAGEPADAREADAARAPRAEDDGDRAGDWGESGDAASEERSVDSVDRPGDAPNVNDLLARRDAALRTDDLAPVGPMRSPSSFERRPVTYGQALRTAVERPLSFGLGWQP